MSAIEFWTLQFLLGAARETLRRHPQFTIIAIWHNSIVREMRVAGAA